MVPRPDRPRLGSGARWALVALGAHAQLVQAALGRELLAAFAGSELSLGAFYGCWLGWIALGAWLGGRPRRRDPGQLLGAVLLVLGPLVVAQWINMEHYFSTVDNERFGSGSKVYHNVAGRFGVMTGNLSDLRTGLPAQTVLRDGMPYHEPMRLITLVDAPLEHVRLALDEVASVKQLVHNGWIRFLVLDPESGITWLFDDGAWREYRAPGGQEHTTEASQS